MGSSFGKIFKLTTFGESHGSMIGGVIEGCPAGLDLDETFIQKELNRRKPGQSHVTTARKEDDKVSFHSGIFNFFNTTTGGKYSNTVFNRWNKLLLKVNLLEV